MIESVLDARDRWLKPGGRLWPTTAELLICPVMAEGFYREKIDFWKDQVCALFGPRLETSATFVTLYLFIWTRCYGASSHTSYVFNNSMDLV